MTFDSEAGAKSHFLHQPGDSMEQATLGEVSVFRVLSLNYIFNSNVMLLKNLLLGLGI